MLAVLAMVTLYTGGSDRDGGLIPFVSRFPRGLEGELNDLSGGEK
jgi:hypothetical protein